MGCFTVFCILCGGPPYSLDEKKTQWLSNCVFLSNHNINFYNTKETMCGDTFKSDKYNNLELLIVSSPIDIINTRYGVFCHTDCYKYLKKRTGMELKYNFLPDNNIDFNYGIFNNFNYKLKKYWGQDFDFLQVYNDKNDDYIYSPLHNKKNASNLNKIISFLKIKKNRIGPQTSASFYKNNIYKIGNDANIWVIKNCKWNKANINKQIISLPISKKIMTKKILTPLGSYSLKPLFYHIGDNKIILVGDEKIISKLRKSIN